MLRRRLSAGALRATAQAQLHTAAPRCAPAASKRSAHTPAASAARANIQPATQSKSLASAVLLNTQRTWKKETVVTLKAELKRRNLSQQGNKATLIARLTSAETTGMLPPVPPIKTPSSKTSAGRPRSISSSRPREAKEDAAEPKPGDVTHSSGDAPVHAPSGGARPDPVPEEVAASHPGLPIKERTTSAPINIKIPSHRDPKEEEQVIPFEPDNFQKPRAPAESEPESKPLHKQVYTPASTTTHPGGGPVHSAKQASDTELEPEMVWDADGKPVSKEDQASLRTAAEIYNLSGVPVSLPTWNPKDGVYETISRPLSDAEKQGTWVLGLGFAGVVAIGYLDNKWSQAKKAKAAGTKEDDKKKN